MAEPTDSPLICKVLKNVQASSASLEGMYGGMRDGFARVRARITTEHVLGALVEGYVARKETGRVNRWLHLAAGHPAPGALQVHPSMGGPA